MIGTIESEQDRQALGARLDHVRGELVRTDDPQGVAVLTDGCFEICEHAVEALRVQHVEQRAELRRLVALVRDTVTMLAGDGDGFASDIEQAADRFSSLLEVTNLHELKTRLASEVGGLQRIALERQQQWRHTVQMFEARVEILERQLHAVKVEAAMDPLTGIPNRRLFEQRLREALEAPERQLVVALFDLDHFKAVNDTGGHCAGDSLLRVVAQSLKSIVRKDDVVARIGGDEFAVLGVGVALRVMEQRLQSILKTLGAISTGVEDPPHVSASCGVAEYCAGDTLESLMRRADQALYDAKHQGRGRLAVKSAPFIRDLMNRQRP
jgi:diguanylate cyclase (GGDEF)-like protein